MNKDLDFVKNLALKINELNGQTMFVGGYVRDKLMGKDNKDIDIEIYGLKADELKNLLSEYGQVDTIGASFGIYKVRGYDIDIALPRSENRIGKRHTDFEVSVNPDLSFYDATKRRDFTINSLMQNVLTGEIIDEHNGLEDLKNKIIRHVNDESFTEDNLRILRACQFASRFNFNIADETLALCKTMDLDEIPRERIFEEFNKGLLKSDKPSEFIKNLDEIGVLDKYFPEIKNLGNCMQDKTNHPEGDVLTHTYMVMDYGAKFKDDVSNKAGFMYGLLLHDIGKPLTQNITDDKITFYKHEEVGSKLSEDIMNRLTDNKELINYVSSLTKNHMKPNMYLDSGAKFNTWRKLADNFNIKDLVYFSECDHMGRANRIEGEFDERALAMKNIIEENSLENKLKPLVRGQDLLNLNVKPSPVYKIALDKAYELQLNNLTKEEILINIQELIGVSGLEDKLLAEKKEATDCIERYLAHKNIDSNERIELNEKEVLYKDNDSCFMIEEKDRGKRMAKFEEVYDSLEKNKDKNLDCELAL